MMIVARKCGRSRTGSQKRNGGGPNCRRLVKGMSGAACRATQSHV
jgi:hypothetical protein